MSARTALGAPLALSLLGHAAFLGVLSGVGHLAGPPPSAAERVILVTRAPEAQGAAARRLRVDLGDTVSWEPEAGTDDAVVPLDSADPRYRPYLSVVKQRIWERWNVPGAPAGPPARGTLVVEFTLTRSGRLAAYAIRETSGVPALDRAALEAVARAVPFTPLPVSIVGQSMRVRARFVYD